ncbi:hypothetical protein Leryth_006213, partial [Lithospermum erythrorhizon]
KECKYKLITTSFGTHNCSLLQLITIKSSILQHPKEHKKWNL